MKSLATFFMGCSVGSITVVIIAAILSYKDMKLNHKKQEITVSTDANKHTTLSTKKKATTTKKTSKKGKT